MLENMNLTPEQQEQMKKRMESMTPEQQEQMIKRMESMTPEQLAEMQKKMGGMSDSEREEMRKKVASMTPEQMAEMSRKQELQRAMQEKMQQMSQGGGKTLMGGKGAAAAKAKDFSGTLKRLFSYLGNQKAALCAVIFFAVFATVCSLVGPFILSSLLDTIKTHIEAGGNLRYDKIARILTGLGVVYVLYSLFSFIQNRLMTNITQKTLRSLRNDADSKLMRLPFSYFDSNSKGDILSRVTNDIDNIGSSLQQTVTQIITSIIVIVGSIILMFTINWSLALMCLAVIPVSILASKSVMKKSQGYFKEQWKHTGSINGLIEEVFSGTAIIKAYNYEEKTLSRFDAENSELYAASRKAQFLSSIMNPVTNAFNNLAYILICVFGAFFVISGKMSYGNITAFIMYQKQYSSPITQLTSVLNTLQSAVASAERVFELLDEAEEPETSETYVKLENVKGEVSFEHLQFGYTPSKLLMKDIDVNVKAGQMVAIVGPTGAGKTTLVNLLMRFYDVSGGKITIDGIDTKDITRQDLREVFGMVLQETWLFNGSIRDNISYGKKNVTEEDIAEVSKAAQIDFFINTLPDGYDTVINEEASNISQGQKQLLTIARAMIANPAILILDEATSSVDTRTEALIQKAMNNLLKGRTSFVIAHRLSTIKDADLILVMKDGNIIEQGTHESLMQSDGLYADLYNSQFAHKEEGLCYYDFTSNLKPAWDEMFKKFTAETKIPVRHLSGDQRTYEKGLLEAMEDDNPPALFKIRSPLILKSEKWSKLCADLRLTDFAAALISEDNCIKTKNGELCAVPYSVECMGLIYNKEITGRYFALKDKAVSISGMREINTLELLTDVVRDMTKHKEELGISGVFPTMAFADNEDHQWKSHVMNLPVFFEYRDRKILHADSFDFKYSENTRKVFDLFIGNNCSTPDKFSSTAAADSVTEFAQGKAVMLLHFNWVWKYMQKKPGLVLKEENLGMIPIPFGTKEEQNQGLTIGNLWMHAINRNADEVHRKQAETLLNWMTTSETGRKCLTAMGYVPPYKTVKSDEMPDGALEKELLYYMNKKDTINLPFIYADMPNGKFRDDFAKSVLMYACGGKEWSEIVSDFISGWGGALDDELARLEING